MEAGGKVIWTPELRFAWGKAKNAHASGGDVAVSDLARTTATFAFYGTGVDWHTVNGPHQGRAQIYVDGALLQERGQLRERPRPRPSERSAVSRSASIELRIVVLGEARPAARGTQTSIDAFTVIP